MCYAIPGRVKSVNKKTVVVDYFGEEKRAINDFYDIQIGDYICAQGGYVIRKVPSREAEEILSAWKELFFELQEIDLRLSRVSLDNNNIDRKLSHILDKALENLPLKKEELLYLFSLEKEESCDLLFKTANFLRQKYHQNSCCVHGIVEISNYCKQKCLYCGISLHNRNLQRYRMKPEEIVDTCVEAVERYGFQALVLQSGEDPYYTVEMLAEVIKEVKKKIPVLICISFGEIGLPGLEELYKAGARGILMRFETSNPELYHTLHPGLKLETRIAHIKRAYELGYLIMTGALVGLPGQRDEDIINDVYLAKKLCAEMFSFGPFIPHPDTPLGREKMPSTEKVLKVLSLARFIDKENAKILVTTAFETMDKEARRKGLLAGANSVMLNVTPLKYRKHYAIYPEKAYSKEAVESQIDEAISLLKSLGRAPTDLGIGYQG